jgi:hypothetical protein
VAPFSDAFVLLCRAAFIAPRSMTVNMAEYLPAEVRPPLPPGASSEAVWRLIFAKLAVKTERAVHHDLPVTEGLVGKDLRLGRLRELQEGIADQLNIGFRELAVFLAQILAQRLEPLCGIDQLYTP